MQRRCTETIHLSKNFSVLAGFLAHPINGLEICMVSMFWGLLRKHVVVVHTIVVVLYDGDEDCKRDQEAAGGASGGRVCHAL